MSTRELTVTTLAVDDEGEIGTDVFEVTISPMTVKYIQSGICRVPGHTDKKTVYVYFVDDTLPLPLLLNETDLLNLRRAVGTYEVDY